MTGRSKSGKSKGTAQSGSNGARSKVSQVRDDKSGGGSGVVVVVPDNTTLEDTAGNNAIMQTIPGRSCLLCPNPDTQEMIQCNCCTSWRHFTCAGVTAAAANESWSCAICAFRNGVQQSSSILPNPPWTGGQHSGGNVSNASQDRFLVSSSRSRGGEASSSVSHGNHVSVASSKRSLLQLQLDKLEEERLLELQEEQRRRLYLQKKYELLEQMNNSNAGSVCSRSSNRIRNWIDDTNQARHDGFEKGPPSSFDPPRPPNGPTGILCSTQKGQALEMSSMTQKQMAARQAVSRDLPIFSGNPEDWPIFVSMFNNTTTMCGFTNEENLIRLQKSLKGKAYETVKSRLMHPSNVPGVMGTLKLMFGQPEAIVHSLIGKINTLPPIKEDRFETLVEFAVTVQNFCATVDACELDDYMYNVTLLHQLVAKLPPTIKLEWARYRQSLPRVNLATFGNWMYTLAEAASAVTIPPITLESKGSRSEARPSKKGNTFLNAHTESSSEHLATPRPFPESKTAARETSEHCPVCKKTCKILSKCQRFLELSRESRWDVVHEFGLCRKCLCRHQGICNAKPCGRNGCTIKHHELLHNDNKPPAAPHQSPATEKPPARALDSQGGPSRVANSAQGCNTHQSITTQ